LTGVSRARWPAGPGQQGAYRAGRAPSPPRWTSWNRWVALVMLASAFLTVLAVAERSRSLVPGDQGALIRNEVSRVFTTVLVQPAGLAQGQPGWLRWSIWRRRHQHVGFPLPEAGAVPVFAVVRSAEEDPGCVPAAPPRVRCRPSTWPPGAPVIIVRQQSMPRHHRRGRAALRQDPPGSSRRRFVRT
jgi:hypothetical protein